MARVFAGATQSVKQRLRIRRVLAYVCLMQDTNGNERTQRVRIGLTGLAFVFLLVLLGTAVSRSGDDAAAAGQGNSLGNAAEPEEPLAQIGVAPGQSSSQNEAVDSASTP